MAKRLKNPEDTGKTVALVALVGAVGYGAYKLFFKPEEPGVPSKLAITAYQNLKTGETRKPNDILDINIGDTIKISFDYGYFGPAISGRYHVAIWKSTFGQPHDEFASKSVSFSLLESPEKIVEKSSIDLDVESFDMTPDMYGLYVKIMGIPGRDIHCDLADVIRVEGGGPGTGTGWLLPNTILAKKSFTFSVGTEVPPGTWLPANTILSKKSFTFSVGTEIPPGTWLLPNTILAKKSFSFLVLGEVPPGTWLPEMAELARKGFTFSVTAPTTISFTVKGDGFPFLTSKWLVYYYDSRGTIWHDGIQHNPDDVIGFNNVSPTGKVACFCASAVTGRWSEQYFSVETLFWDGYNYKYDIVSGKIFFR